MFWSLYAYYFTFVPIYDKIVVGDRRMQLENYVLNLLENIRYNIEYDSDVEAIYSLLKKLNSKKGITIWVQILNETSILDLRNNIDFTFLLKNYPEDILRKEGYLFWDKYIKKVNYSIRKIILQEVFNIYELNSIVYYLFRNSLGTLEDADLFINWVLKMGNQECSLYFDETLFLKNIIITYLETDNFKLEYLKKLSEITYDLKEQAVLKALWIDKLDETGYNKQEGWL